MANNFKSTKSDKLTKSDKSIKSNKLIEFNKSVKLNYELKSYNDIKPSYKNDFYGYVNYDWIKSTLIPNDEIKYTHFIQTQHQINNTIKQILESNMYPLGTLLYNSYFNNDESMCLEELKQITNIINDITNKDELIIMITKLIFINIDTLFTINVDANIYSSCNNILYICQPNLELPDRAYYNDVQHKKTKQKYYETICKIYNILYPNLTNNEINNIASLILDIETKLAIILLSNADRRDTNTTYHLNNKDYLINKYPKLRFDLVIKTLCILTDNELIEENFDKIIMEHNLNDENNYFKQLEILLDAYTISNWCMFLKFKIIMSFINLTTKELKNIHFDMFKKTLRGQLTPKQDWRLAMSITTNLLSDPISRIYTHNNYNEKMETYMKEMVKHIKRATKKRILNLDWMSETTKKRAILKLHRMKLKLGYSTSTPRTYSNVMLSPSIIKNIIILNHENAKYNFVKLNTTVDLNDWDLPAYVVNAYFNPTRNEIIFPTSILQSPFFDLTKSDIYNYAHIGSIIGHEIIHGFDDQGSKYDESGSLNDWWTSKDKTQYESKVNQIIEIYNEAGINGKLTAGENIADFGAVIMPLYALTYKFGRDLTNDEIREFYVQYANHWQYLLRPEAVIERKLSDPHAFADLRVNIPLKHSEIFQKVYHIKPQDKMYIDPINMLKIW